VIAVAIVLSAGCSDVTATPSDGTPASSARPSAAPTNSAPAGSATAHAASPNGTPTSSAGSSATPTGSAPTSQPAPTSPARTAFDAAAPDAVSGDPSGGNGNDEHCATRVVSGDERTVLGGALYDQFRTGSYTGELDLRGATLGDSSDPRAASISTLDLAFTGEPFVELSRADSGATCTPQVRFSVYVNLWSERDTVVGSFTAQGTWTESPRSVRLEMNAPLSSLQNGLASASGLRGDDRFRFSFDLLTLHGTATLMVGSTAPPFFDWSPFCPGGHALPGDPALVDPRATNCGAISNFASAGADVVAMTKRVLDCAKSDFTTGVPASISFGAWGGNGAAGTMYASLGVALAAGRAPYAEIYRSAANPSLPTLVDPPGQLRRCEAITVDSACTPGDDSGGPCLTCVSPGPWIPMCAPAAQF
jgi:hypothetical protein